MKPNPFASLNHFTVPVMRAMNPFLVPFAGLTVMPIPPEPDRACGGVASPA
jgi:hypothetical protein